MAETIENTGEPEVVENVEEVEPASFDTSKWEVTEDFREKHFKNDKLLDRFDSIEDLVSEHNKLRAKHANFVREVKDGEKASKEEVEQVQTDREIQNKKDEIMNSLASELISNGMDINDDIKAKLAENDISQEQLELNAYKSRDMINRVYESVGGKEEYEAMASWAKEVLPEDVREDFDKNLTGKSAQIYIQGLHAQYKEQSENPQAPQENTTERIVGSNASVGIKPYSSMDEVITGKNTNPEMHQKRMAMTPDKVIFNR